MKIVIQRVSRACVRIEAAERASIGPGLVLLVAVERGDDDGTVSWAADKIAGLRAFPGERGGERMERSVLETGGEVLVVSQFTLAASLHKGRRPSFDAAAPPEQAEPIYERLVAALRERGARVSTGVFRAMMQVELVNDGPVTFVLEPGR